MKNTYFQISTSDKHLIVERLRYYLEKRQNLLFAYVYGSFVTADRFRDIDVAVYLKDASSTPIQAELEIEAELSHIIKNYRIDVRILNNAPLSFRYNVIKSGEPIAAVDDWIMKTPKRMSILPKAPNICLLKNKSKYQSSNAK